MRRGRFCTAWSRNFGLKSDRAYRGPLTPAAEERSRLRLVSPGAKGLRDLWRGWRDYRELWLAVGWYDIRKRYRRSVLGPF
jgi:hypothetical protein